MITPGFLSYWCQLSHCYSKFSVLFGHLSNPCTKWHPKTHTNASIHTHKHTYILTLFQKKLSPLFPPPFHPCLKKKTKKLITSSSIWNFLKILTLSPHKKWGIMLIETIIMMIIIMVLCQKDLSKGNAVDNYRSISCLLLMWKLMTITIPEIIYNFLDVNDKLTVEQKGCRGKSWGTKDQLLIDKTILHDCRKKYTYLEMA